MYATLRMIVVLVAGTTLSACAHNLRKNEIAGAGPVSIKVAGLASAADDAEAETDAEAEVAAAQQPSPPLKVDGPVTSNDLKDSGEDLKTVPHEVNRLVLQWIDYFQGRGREHMERYLSRSGRYIPLMREILHKEGLPEDLVYVALIESGFNAHAHSSANAVGYWQFIRATGRRYGLRIDSYIDERRDFVKSTLAAGDYLKGLYNLFGSWYLAIASYNVGENRIKNLVMRYHTRDFWKLAKEGKLPRETINYVPKFLAARMIAKEPEKYGFTDIEYMEPLNFKEIEVAHAVDLRKMAKEMNIDFEDLRALNPSYKRGIALESGGKLILRVPSEQAEQASVAAATALVVPGRVLRASVATAEDDFSYYRVRRGDTASSIARRYRTTVKAIRKLNRLDRRMRLIAGRRIRVPGESLVGLARKKTHRASAKAVRGGGRKIHIVRRGDTLSDIARRYRVSLHQLASHNQIRKKSKIAIGTRLEIPE